MMLKNIWNIYFKKDKKIVTHIDNPFLKKYDAKFQEDFKPPVSPLTQVVGLDKFAQETFQEVNRMTL